MKTKVNPDQFKSAHWYIATSLANLRQQDPPRHVGNALTTSNDESYALCLVLGSVTPFGGNAAIYAWSASSALADNNSTVIKPDSPQVGGNPGRWLIVGATL